MRSTKVAGTAATLAAELEDASGFSIFLDAMQTFFRYWLAACAKRMLLFFLLPDTSRKAG